MAAEEIDPGLVEALRKQVKDLRAEVEANRERIAELESERDSNGSGSGSGSGVSGYDAYDSAVLATLEEGEIVGPVNLHHRYLNSTTIVNRETAKRRAKSLVKRDIFEDVGRGYRYVGSVDEDDDENEEGEQ